MSEYITELGKDGRLYVREEIRKPIEGKKLRILDSPLAFIVVPLDAKWTDIKDSIRIILKDINLREKLEKSNSKKG